MTHLWTDQASTKLVAKNSIDDTVDDDSRPGVANISKYMDVEYAKMNALLKVTQ